MLASRQYRRQKVHVQNLIAMMMCTQEKEAAEICPTFQWIVHCIMFVPVTWRMADVSLSFSACFTVLCFRAMKERG